MEIYVHVDTKLDVLHLTSKRSNATANRLIEWREKVIFKSFQQAKRFLKILFGFTLLALGIVMIVTPGPGWITIMIALGVLAAEFVWARRLLDRMKEQGLRLRDSVMPRAKPVGD
jgi:uncharacterized protein (TIGR02611 family)